jgi:hypothetical protein
METSVSKDELTSQDGPQLAAQARAAYDKRRTKECLALAKQVLLLDPDNAEAKDLQAAVQSHIQQDFNDACALIEESSKMEDGRKHRKSAEIMLLRILYIDPAHAEAKALLASSKASFGPAPEAVPEPAPMTPMMAPMMAPPSHEEIAFTARPEPVARIKAPRPSMMTGRNVAMVLAAIIFLMGGFVLFKSRGTSQAAGTAANAQPKTASAAAPSSSRSSNLEPPIAGPVAWAVAAAPVAQQISMAKPAELAIMDPGITTAAETGSLAVSSLLPADIFVNGANLGSTPTTLELNAGRHSVEYRHGDLRTVMIHTIRPGQTTTALVAFEIPVQINARPWAQVFLEGANRKSLGQTPISSVRVPIGGILTFENPNFPSKSHRVTDTDSTVRMVFP